MNAAGMAKRSILRLALLCGVLVASGCATVQEPLRGDMTSASPPVQSCAGWLQSLDGTIDRAGVRDAQPWRVPGFPYLRMDRFTASYAHEAARSSAVFDAWVARARMLDREARRVELQNLPAAYLAGLHASSRQAAIERTESCAAELEAHDLADPGTRARLIRLAAVPSGYDHWERAIGLYPLTRIPFAEGVRAWHADAENTFRRFASGEPANGKLVRYAPPSQGLSAEQVATIIARRRGNPLGIPAVTAQERAALLATFAPVFEVQTSGEYDRIGALGWGGGTVPVVHVSQPTVYGRLAFTRYGDAVLPQLVYTAWFSERPASSDFDVLAGNLDGLVFRVTLGPDGLPLVYDSIHPCGCYHMFFPTRRVRALPSPRPGDEWAFSPAPAPTVGASPRILLYVASRTHYLSGIGVYDAPARANEAVEYRFAPESAVLELPLPEGGTRSLFGPDGLVAGTERPERLLFWPMGVPSAGTMRQSGARETAFLGERHFDDADLIERRFRIVEQ